MRRHAVSFLSQSVCGGSSSSLSLAVSIATPERYDGDLTDIFTLQDEITKKVVAAIEPKLLEAEGIRSQSRCPFRKSYPDVLVMQSSQDRNGDNGARSLDCSMQGRIFL